MEYLIFFIATLINKNEYIVVEDHCDCVEVNHKYNPETGNIEIDQLIFWNFYTKAKSVNKICIDYRLLNRRRECSREEKEKLVRFYKKNHVKLPINYKYTVWRGIFIEKRKSFYVYIFSDGPYIRKIVAKSYIETWTPYDPEVLNRKILDKDSRKRLTSSGIYKW